MLQYSSFATLSKRVKQDALRTGCSERVAEWAIQGQLYLDELNRDHLGWRTAWHQEGGSSYWIVCSTMQQLCEGGSEKETQEGTPTQ